MNDQSMKNLLRTDKRLGRVACISEMRSIATHFALSVVCVSRSRSSCPFVFGLRVDCAKTAESIEMPFEFEGRLAWAQ